MQRLNQTGVLTAFVATALSGWVLSLTVGRLAMAGSPDGGQAAGSNAGAAVAADNSPLGPLGRTKETKSARTIRPGPEVSPRLKFPEQTPGGLASAKPGFSAGELGGLTDKPANLPTNPTGDSGTDTFRWTIRNVMTQSGGGLRQAMTVTTTQTMTGTMRLVSVDPATKAATLEWTYQDVKVVTKLRRGNSETDSGQSSGKADSVRMTSGVPALKGLTLTLVFTKAGRLVSVAGSEEMLKRLAADDPDGLLSRSAESFGAAAMARLFSELLTAYLPNEVPVSPGRQWNRTLQQPWLGEGHVRWDLLHTVTASQGEGQGQPAGVGGQAQGGQIDPKQRLPAKGGAGIKSEISGGASGGATPSTVTIAWEGPGAFTANNKARGDSAADLAGLPVLTRPTEMTTRGEATFDITRGWLARRQVNQSSRGTLQIAGIGGSPIDFEQTVTDTIEFTFAKPPSDTAAGSVAGSAPKP